MHEPVFHLRATYKSDNLGRDNQELPSLDKYLPLLRTKAHAAEVNDLG